MIIMTNMKRKSCGSEARRAAERDLSKTSAEHTKAAVEHDASPIRTLTCVCVCVCIYIYIYQTYKQHDVCIYTYIYIYIT